MDLMKKRKLDDNNNGVIVSDIPVTVTHNFTIEDAKKLLEPLTSEQTLEILQNAVIHHNDILDAVRLIADRDTTQRKLFIRGLGWETTTDKLRGVFGNYGELEEAIVILDKATGKSKGYGFVTFKHVDSAIIALKEPSKKIDGRITVTQLASAGIQGGPGGGNLGNSVDVSLRKIYVANVPYDMQSERILQHFSMYGEIEEGPLGFDKATGKSKGYALFVYKTVEAARAALVDSVKNIDGHVLNCKLAIDGKKGKPGVVGTVAGQVQTDGHGDPMGPGPVQYGVPPPSGGVTGYGGYSGLSSYSGHGHGPNPALGSGNGIGVGVGGSSFGSQPPISGGGYGSGIGGGPYGGGSHYGGPGSAGYGGLTGSASGVGGGFGSAGAVGGAAGALGGGGGRGSSMYGLPPPSSTGLPSAGDYPPQGSHYGSLHQPHALQNQAPGPGASGAPRVPPGGGMYQGMHSYY
ncbi:UBP1-associated protein 2C-like [Lycium barbarum]|uniref:UBP1-associated protein 2C-like n=1 Tax=Lycium barbarum TaxID=112863 RepID=UPI00293E8EB3|nr:UBP1-associated protein 2C-like [Lycium barbarum]XP_060209268.1 UBP1-associated protein 2C-like [Lycium barbarum]